MKHFTSVFFFVFVCEINLMAQWKQTDFDRDYSWPRIIFYDDSSIANRSWQIGWPNKTIFDKDPLFKKGLCTDTLNVVNSGDTFSVISIFKTYGVGMMDCGFEMSFDYKLDADSGDRAKVELSADTGKTWVDIMANDTLYDIVWIDGKPLLNGQISKLITYHADLSTWAYGENFQKYPVKLKWARTILYRFTFIAGSSSRPRDGWLIDNLVFVNCYSDINSIADTPGTFSLYPNPASESLSIRSTNDASIRQWQIFNLYGEKMSEGDGTNAQTIDVNHLSNGLYIARILSEGQWYSLKFEITTP